MAGSRSALIVATYRYDDVRLQQLQAPQRDADALAEVLGDPGIGGFEVKTVVNESSHDISVALAVPTNAPPRLRRGRARSGSCTRTLQNS